MKLIHQEICPFRFGVHGEKLKDDQFICLVRQERGKCIENEGRNACIPVPTCTSQSGFSMSCT